MSEFILSNCWAGVRRVICSTERMFCSTVSLRNTEFSCARYPTPYWARLYIGKDVISVSSRKTFPPLAWISPTIM